MTTSDSDANLNQGQPSVKGGVPVMFCQTADNGGSSKRLARGSTPSTPDGNADAQKEKRRLSELMFFRCTPEDRDAIKTNAAKSGLDLSSYMRMQCLQKPIIRAYRHVRTDWQELHRCMGIINKAGNLINQLVRHLHRGGIPTNCADAALIELCKAARAIMAALGKE
jgi:hypothetical protein